MATATIEPEYKKFSTIDEVTPADVEWLLAGTYRLGSRAYHNSRGIYYTSKRGKSKLVRGYRFDNGNVEWESGTLRNWSNGLTLEEMRVFAPSEYEKRVERKAEAKRKQDESEKTYFKVGDVLESSFGYDATLYDFYQVVRVSASRKTVWLRELRQETKPMNGCPCGWYCRPVVGSFRSDAAEERHTVQWWDGEPYVKVGYGTVASPCDPNKWFEADDYH